MLLQVALCGWLMVHAARIHLQTYGASKLCVPPIPLPATKPIHGVVGVTRCRWCLPFNFNPASSAPASAMNPDLAYIVWVFYLSKVGDV